MKPIYPKRDSEIILRLISPDNEIIKEEEISIVPNQFTLAESIKLSEIDTIAPGNWKISIGINSKFTEVSSFRIDFSKPPKFKVYIEHSEEKLGISSSIMMTIFGQHTLGNTFVSGEVTLRCLIYDPSDMTGHIAAGYENTFSIAKKKLINLKVSSLGIPKNLEIAIVKVSIEIKEKLSSTTQKSEAVFQVLMQDFTIRVLDEKEYFVHGNRYDFGAEIMNLDGTTPVDQILEVNITETYLDRCVLDDESQKKIHHKSFPTTVNLVSGKLFLTFQPSSETKRLEISITHDEVEKKFYVSGIPADYGSLDTSITTRFAKIDKLVSVVVASKQPMRELHTFKFNEYGFIESRQDRVDDESVALNLKPTKSTNNFLFIEQSSALRFGAFQVKPKTNLLQPEIHQEKEVNKIYYFCKILIILHYTGNN